MKGKFGWDLPPGVTNRMIEEQAGAFDKGEMSDQPPAGLENESVDIQVAWFKEHSDLTMRYSQWELYYSSNISHRGLCCESCLGDADYDAEHGTCYYDESRCCCRAKRRGKEK